MKNLNLLLCICLIVLNSCSTNKNISEAPNPIKTTHSQMDGIADLIQKSGINKLIREKANWNKVHQNFLAVTHQYKHHKYLNAYTTKVINYQLSKTSILEDVNANNYKVLASYLMELKSVESPYTKNNFLLIKALQPHLNREILLECANISCQKATNSKEYVREGIALQTENDEFEVELKQKLQENYKQEYEEYFSKLEAFIQGA